MNRKTPVHAEPGQMKFSVPLQLFSPKRSATGRHPAQTEEMIRYVDDHRDQYGVEPICKVLPIAPSTYYDHKILEQDPRRESNRSIQGRHLDPEIERVWKKNFEVYGVPKVWCQMKREGFVVARCTLERLMQKLGPRGVTRGPKKYWTTITDDSQSPPADLVNREFIASRPNQLWVADITFVATWSGFVRGFHC